MRALLAATAAALLTATAPAAGAAQGPAAGGPAEQEAPPARTPGEQEPAVEEESLAPVEPEPRAEGEGEGEGESRNGEGEGEAQEPGPLALEATTTGYFDSRLLWQHLAPAGLVPPGGVPSWYDLSEGNVQVKVRAGPRLHVGADASLFWQWAGGFRGVDAGGEPVDVPAQDQPAYRPTAVLSELYASWEVAPSLQLTLGKKRVVWGSGMAFNPTDLLNPPKDPTDPAGQRAGAWLARVELPFERFSVSLVGAAKVTRQYAGLPTALLRFPPYPSSEAARGGVPDDRDGHAHWAAAARLYALVADTDVTLTYHLTHRYNDAFAAKSRVGLSLSRTFAAAEVHLEALLQTGSSRVYVDPACAGGLEALAACAARGTPVASRSALEARDVRAKVLLGTRYLFADEAMLSAEYLFNGEGYSGREFGDVVGLLAAARALQAAAPERAAALAGALGTAGSGDPGSPQRFTFEPLRRHYLFLTYSKPRVAEDWTLGGSAVVNLADLSGQLIPQVTWSAQEWLSLTAAAFVPLPGVDALAAGVGGVRYPEAALAAVDWRAQLSARLFF
jgi:hypothetical protein